MATGKKTTAKGGGGKAPAPNIDPGIEDPWGRLAATVRSFGRKAQTNPEHARELLTVGRILTHLADPDFRAEVSALLRKHLEASQSPHGLAYYDAQRFAESVKFELLADTLDETARSVLSTLEAFALLWGRPGKLIGAGSKRPPKLNLETIEAALRTTYVKQVCVDFRAEAALALVGEGSPARFEASERFQEEIDGPALARKVLNAVGVDPRWVNQLFEKQRKSRGESTPIEYPHPQKEETRGP